MKLGYDLAAHIFGSVMLISGIYSAVWFNYLTQLCISEHLMCPNYGSWVDQGIFLAVAGAVIISSMMVRRIRRRPSREKKIVLLAFGREGPENTYQPHLPGT